eukprot:14631497-Alexandrium_andersonii.AAC.1
MSSSSDSLLRSTSSGRQAPTKWGGVVGRIRHRFAGGVPKDVMQQGKQRCRPAQGLRYKNSRSRHHDHACFLP